jgi:hypothetical protein
MFDLQLEPAQQVEEVAEDIGRQYEPMPLYRTPLEDQKDTMAGLTGQWEHPDWYLYKTHNPP